MIGVRAFLDFFSRGDAENPERGCWVSGDCRGLVFVCWDSGVVDWVFRSLLAEAAAAKDGGAERQGDWRRSYSRMSRWLIVSRELWLIDRLVFKGLPALNPSV